MAPAAPRRVRRVRRMGRARARGTGVVGVVTVLHHDVLRLQVAVHDPALVAVFQCTEELEHDAECILLLQVAVAAEYDLVEELAAADVLEDEVDVAVVLESLMKPANVGMVQALEYPNLALRPLSRVWDAPVHGLHSAAKVGTDEPGLPHGAKAALTKRLGVHLVEIRESRASIPVVEDQPCAADRGSFRRLLQQRGQPLARLIAPARAAEGAELVDRTLAGLALGIACRCLFRRLRRPPQSG